MLISMRLLKLMWKQVCRIFISLKSERGRESTQYTQLLQANSKYMNFCRITNLDHSTHNRPFYHSSNQPSIHSAIYSHGLVNSNRFAFKFLSLFVVDVFLRTYVHRWLLRAQLPKNLQHFKVCEEIRHRSVKVEASRQWCAQTSQQLGKRFFFLSDPWATFVLHLIRRNVYVNVNGEACQGFKKTS